MDIRLPGGCGDFVGVDELAIDDSFEGDEAKDDGVDVGVCGMGSGEVGGVVSSVGGISWSLSVASAIVSLFTSPFKATGSEPGIGGTSLATAVPVPFVGSGGLRASSLGSITATSTLSSVPKLEGVPMKLDGRGRGSASARAAPLLAKPFRTWVGFDRFLECLFDYQEDHQSLNSLRS